MSRKRKITMVLTGTDELNRKLAELKSAQAKAAIRKAARPALQPTLAAARAGVPKRTGRLSRSIKIRAIKRSRTRVGMRVTTAKGDNQFTGKTFYAAFIEWGWKTGARKHEPSAVARRAGLDPQTAGGKVNAREGAKRAVNERPHVRRKISGTEALKRAARSTRSQALKLYADGIREYIRSIASS